MDTTPITRAILTGFLRAAGGGEVNVVNAPAFAETTRPESHRIARERVGRFYGADRTHRHRRERLGVSVAGTFFGTTPRIVKINGRHVEAKPEGVLFLLENRDRPGIVGYVGTLMGKHEREHRRHVAEPQ